jgi:hypothetical protein
MRFQQTTNIRLIRRPFSSLTSYAMQTPAVPQQQQQHSAHSTNAHTTVGGKTPLIWADPKTGEFQRQISSFRSKISRDPNAEFPAEAGRYHLYASYACPWGN